MNNSSKSISLLFLMTMLFLFSCQQEIKKNSLLEYGGKYPDESSSDIQIIFSDEGIKSFELFAPVMNTYNPTDSHPEINYMDCPKGIKIISFDELGNEQSILTADYAINDQHNRIMEARHHVVLKNMEKNETIETEQIIWDKPSAKIYSKVLVKQTKADGTVNYGDGFDADEKFTKYTVWHPRGEVLAADINE
ncbi:MAG: LPS export ABC transporter periplasmic protein LptC [Bacteroidales bacterium]|nr:LPS export ABC transporter periplasmic protein LptC [Bacteroidales bacterium]